MLYKDRFGRIVDNDELNMMDPIEIEERQLHYCEDCFDFS